jgi:hypothetical protein
MPAGEEIMYKAFAPFVGFAAAAFSTATSAETLKVAVAQRGFWNSHDGREACLDIC